MNDICADCGNPRDNHKYKKLIEIADCALSECESQRKSAGEMFDLGEYPYSKVSTAETMHDNVLLHRTRMMEALACAASEGDRPEVQKLWEKIAKAHATLTHTI